MLGGQQAQYLGADNGVRIIQPDVVINADVVNVRVVGVNPQGLPTLAGEVVSGPPATQGSGSSAGTGPLLREQPVGNVAGQAGAHHVQHSQALLSP